MEGWEVWVDDWIRGKRSGVGVVPLKFFFRVTLDHGAGLEHNILTTHAYLDRLRFVFGSQDKLHTEVCH